MSTRLNTAHLFLLFVVFFATQGCVKHNQLLLFDESNQASFKTVRTPAITLEPDDVVIFYVAADSPENEDIVSPYNISEEPFEYVVDEEGYLSLPFGKVAVGGKTMVEAREEIRTSLSRYLTNPAVILKLKTFKISIAGEVTAPGTFQITEERISILEAIGLAGDLTVYADRASIWIIREKEKEVVFEQINLHSRKFTETEYFYLKQNDHIYVPPIKQRTASIADPNTRIIPYIGLGTSIINIVLILTKL